MAEGRESPDFSDKLRPNGFRCQILSKQSKEVNRELQEIADANVEKTICALTQEDIIYLDKRMQFPRKTIGGGGDKIDFNEARHLLIAFIQDHPAFRTDDPRKLIGMLKYYFDLPDNANLHVKNEQQIPNWQLPYQRLKGIIEVDDNEEEDAIGLIKETKSHIHTHTHTHTHTHKT